MHVNIYIDVFQSVSPGLVDTEFVRAKGTKFANKPVGILMN